jgi:hypothetical protein
VGEIKCILGGVENSNRKNILKKQLGRYRSRWKDNIKMNLKEIYNTRMSTAFIWLRTLYNNGKF